MPTDLVYFVSNDSTVSGNVLDDDTGAGQTTDLNGDPLFVDESSISYSGTAELYISSDGYFTYTPPGGFTGLDVLSFVVEDADGQSATAMATFVVHERSNVILDIWDGQFDHTIQPEYNLGADRNFNDPMTDREFHRGAFTLANLNDTDSDNQVDRDDNYVWGHVHVYDAIAGSQILTVGNAENLNGVEIGDPIWIYDRNAQADPLVPTVNEQISIVAINTNDNTITLAESLTNSYPANSATIDGPGRDEQDLMRLVLFKPEVVDSNDHVTLMVTHGSSKVRIWKYETKIEELVLEDTPEARRIDIPLSAFPPATDFVPSVLNYWVEVVEPSRLLKNGWFVTMSASRTWRV
jgi:hypothetical protein